MRLTPSGIDQAIAVYVTATRTPKMMCSMKNPIAVMDG